MSDSAEPNPLAAARARKECVERRMQRWIPRLDETCNNCGTRLLGPYCHACGQPTKHFIRHIPSVLKDLMEGLFNIDSRILRTLGTLMFRPGRLTMEYIAGRRARYTAPLQLYLIVSVLLFVSLSWITKVSNDLVLTTEPGELSIGPKVTPAEAAVDDLKPMLATQKTEPTGPALPQEKKPISDDNPLDISFGNGPWHPLTNPIVISALSPEWNQRLNRHIATQGTKLKAVSKDPRALIEQSFKLAPYAMFFLMPLYALLLALVYVFKRRYYIEHLIFAVHMHCFSFVLQIVYLGIYETQKLLDVATSAPLAVLLSGLLFWQFFGHLWAQKRVYAQGWIMTSLKYFFVLLCYALLAAFAVVGIVLAAVLTF